MEQITDPLLAPFSTDAAAKTTVAKVAVAYTVVGVLLGLFVLNKRPAA